MCFIRKQPKASDGWDGGDIDEAVALFQQGTLWDGNHPSKDSRDWFARQGYVVRWDGYSALTGKGKIAALISWPMPLVWFRIWRRRGSSPFTPSSVEPKGHIA